jgi:hypothetical protein
MEGVINTSSAAGSHIYSLFHAIEATGSCTLTERNRKALGTQISRMQPFYKFVSTVLQTMHMAELFPKADDPLKSIYQCLGQDLVLYDHNNRRIPDNQLANTPDDHLRGLTVTCRLKKNGDNGQKIDHATNYKDPKTSVPARVAKRIKLHALRFALMPDMPLSCYKENHGTKQPNWFHSNTIRALLQSMAMTTCNMPKAAELKERGCIYSSHSIRTTACFMSQAPKTASSKCGSAGNLQHFSSTCAKCHG